MSNQNLFERVTGGNEDIPADWMPATKVRPFVFEDPSIIWLEYHGKIYGFEPDKSPYDFLDFISEKAKQFENKWTEMITPEAIRICKEIYDVRSPDKVKETIEYLKDGVPVLAQPALWWSKERIYGVPDFIVHSSWLRGKFPKLVIDSGSTSLLNDTAISGYYLILDLKFTTKLDESAKLKDFLNYSAQVRIYSYMLGQIQGYMPSKAFLIARDRIFDPLEIDIKSKLEQPLDEDLAKIRNKFIDIKKNGAKYLPWKDEIVLSNLANDDERWMTAKNIMANEKFPGRDPLLLHQIGPGLKQELNNNGFSIFQFCPFKSLICIM